jgi:hypothetical protein
MFVSAATRFVAAEKNAVVEPVQVADRGADVADIVLVDAGVPPSPSAQLVCTRVMRSIMLDRVALSAISAGSATCAVGPGASHRHATSDAINCIGHQPDDDGSKLYELP